MKALFLNIILLIVAVSATAQIRPVESLPIAVNYSKTVSGFMLVMPGRK